MRKSVKIGAGLTSAAIVASMAAGVATAAASGQRPATGSASLSTASTANVTRAQARHLARAAVPHSRVIEVESDDLHDRAVWKVKLATPHGRVVADVDKRTGKVTIVKGHRHGGGHGHGGDDHNRGHDGDG
jgi:Peptidase propeptide and YPEB domain